MKVVQVIGVMNYGGAEKLVMDIVRKSHEDFEYHFIINVRKGNKEKGSFDEELLQLGIKLYEIEAVWQNNPLRYINQFISIINRIGKVDVVHTHLNSRNGIISFAAYKSGVDKIISHCHANLVFRGSLKSRLFNTLELKFEKKLVNKYATDFWSCTEKAHNSLYSTKNIKSNKCIAINNAIDLNQYYIGSENIDNIRDLFHIDSKFIVGSVGRIAKIKNYIHSLKIIKLMRDNMIDIHYIIYGALQDTQEYDLLIDFIKNNNLENFVTFAGVSDRLEHIYPNFDLFIASSLLEGFGMSALEAQASGVPVILSTGFPSDVDMEVGLVKRIELSNDLLWLKSCIELLNTNQNDLNNIHNHIKKKGFDLKTNIFFISKAYRSKNE